MFPRRQSLLFVVKVPEGDVVCQEEKFRRLSSNQDSSREGRGLGGGREITCFLRHLHGRSILPELVLSVPVDRSIANSTIKTSSSMVRNTKKSGSLSSAVQKNACQEIAFYAYHTASFITCSLSGSIPRCRAKPWSSSSSISSPSSIFIPPDTTEGCGQAQSLVTVMHFSTPSTPMDRQNKLPSCEVSASVQWCIPNFAEIMFAPAGHNSSCQRCRACRSRKAKAQRCSVAVDASRQIWLLAEHRKKSCAFYSILCTAERLVWSAASCFGRSWTKKKRSCHMY